MNTVQDTRNQLAEQRKKTELAQQWFERIIADLPDNVPMPTISNQGDKTHDGKPGAWISFRRNYGDTWQGSDILATLETTMTPLPSSWARYGTWRGRPHHGLQDELPETSSRDNLADSEPIAPVWINPNQHTEPEAHAYYKGKSGLIYRVTVPAPSSAGIYAKRVEFRGGWRFERATARLRYPEKWHSICDDAGAPITQISVHSRAYVDTEQGISGAIYFTPFLDPTDFPLTPSQFLRKLES